MDLFQTFEELDTEEDKFTDIKEILHLFDEAVT